ncbi:MAG TPA: hypothetical protein VD993_06640 [Chitinophagaceae bacterium]|nr:hypothetical protein [Chitinophagaceae bacterium]
MSLQPVISREYKLVLKAANFPGGESQLLEHAGRFWEAFEKIVAPAIGSTTGTLVNIDKQREIRFYDTKDFILRNKSFIARKRMAMPDGEQEVTLKSRHEDRYVSQDRDMSTQKKDAGKVKFEEDIKAPFLKLYSFSATQPIEADTKFEKIKHIVKLYPGLAEEMEGHMDEPIVLVNDRTAHEIVVTGATINLGENLTAAECALITWYKQGELQADPLIVEFSFRYGSKKEKYDRKTALSAYALFLAMQEQLQSWIADKDATKTNFMFEA